MFGSLNFERERQMVIMLEVVPMADSSFKNEILGEILNLV